MKEIGTLFAAAMLLLGCYPTADDPVAFRLEAKANVSDTVSFQDCMLEGLSELEGSQYFARTVRQQIRSNKMRIDTFGAGNSVQLTRTEIENNGSAQIYVADYLNVALISKDPELRIFGLCTESN